MEPLKFLNIMKKTILLLILAVVPFVYSCSKDDDGPEADLRFPDQLLVDGSPWNFSDIEILRVVYNPNNLTVAQAQSRFKTIYTGFIYDFKENGTGSVTAPDNSSYSFNWSITSDWSTLTLTGVAPAVFNNVEITANKFMFSDTEYCVADGQGDDVCADVRFTFE